MLRSILSSLKEKDKYSYYKETEVLVNEPNPIKIRLYIRNDLFVQVYCNDESSIIDFALVSFPDRVFARDKVGRTWHHHPMGNPSFHDRSQEGRKSTNFKKFLKEVDQILKELKLI